MTPEELEALAGDVDRLGRAEAYRHNCDDGMVSTLDAAAAALREAAETARRVAELEAWQDAVLDAVQTDLENGVKWLNDVAAEDFQARFPTLCAALARAGGDDA